MNFRIYRHSEANFYNHGDLENTDLHYSDAWFQKLRDHGFNGFWLNVWMRRLVAFREPETSAQIQCQDVVKRLMDRAARYDVGVWLYLNEPKAFPRSHRIWGRFPSLRGAPGTWDIPPIETYLLCTTSREGQAYVYEMARRLFTILPGLAGTIHINASEFPTHCYCHTITNPGGKVFASDQEHLGIDCPRCAERTPGEVIAEILNLFHRGCRDAGSQTPVVAWNWNWIMYAPHPQVDLISRLDRDIMVMADFECGGKTDILGQERLVSEYSLIYVGPSERYQTVTECAIGCGLRHAAKLQLGATHEMGTVANMPLVGNIFEKLAFLHRSRCEGIFGTWNFGNRFTLNTAAVGAFFTSPDTKNKSDFLHRLARQYLGIENPESFAPLVAEIEAAFRFFPQCNPMLYFGPVNYALALPLDDAPPTGTPLTASYFLRERGDKWEDCLGPFTFDEVIGGFESLTHRLNEAVRRFEALLFPSGSPWATVLKTCQGPPVIPRHADRLSDEEMADGLRRALPADGFRALPELNGVFGLRRLEEWSNAWFMLACLESTIRLFKNYVAKRTKRPDYQRYLEELQAEERRTLDDCIPLLALDARLGLHLESQAYLVTADALRQKLATLEHH